MRPNPCCSTFGGLQKAANRFITLLFRFCWKWSEVYEFPAALEYLAEVSLWLSYTNICMLLDMLEMLMRQAFQSLPSMSYGEFYGSIALNVLPPLFDGINIAKEVRMHYVILASYIIPYARSFLV